VNTSSFISHSEEETRKFAAEFAGKLRGDEKICLIGPLGSGKTVFVRGFVESFGISSAEVMSPTFTLVREYGSTVKIYHVDLYRLNKEEDIFEAGIYEILTSDHLVLVEWADRLQKYFPSPCIIIHFSHHSENARFIEVNHDLAS
jgi:tRNA threonylcarbamoyladenosine biosynthesis protein TsaE